MRYGSERERLLYLLKDSLEFQEHRLYGDDILEHVLIRSAIYPEARLVPGIDTGRWSLQDDQSDVASVLYINYSPCTHKSINSIRESTHVPRRSHGTGELTVAHVVQRPRRFRSWSAPKQPWHPVTSDSETKRTTSFSAWLLSSSRPSDWKERNENLFFIPRVN